MGKHVTQKALHELVDKYARNRTEYLGQSYNETSLRVEFLNPLFQLLGWDVDNAKGFSIYSREVIHESAVTVDDEDPLHSAKRPDYAFRIGGETKFFLEAKKPSVNILERQEPAFQTRRYGWNGNHPIAVLSNFEDLSIYDCSFRPQLGESASYARLAHFHFDELEKNFDFISNLLSKDAVLNGSLGSISSPELKAKEPFDNYFLGQIRLWRSKLAEDVLARYEVSDDNALDLFTQSILDRIIFLRVCEDRNLSRELLLSDVSSFDEMKSLFLKADKVYDSGLFRCIDDAPWRISDAVVKEIIGQMYFPNSPYDFNVVQPHVIGQIYDQFLSEHIYVHDGVVALERTAEAVESHGVVPTPKEITDAIVENTLEGIFLPCRVADICCGSGNFLLSLYEYLVSDELRRIMAEKSPVEAGLVQRESGLDLPFWRKREIVASSIFGVDIDPLAVEVAKFSLSLRLLEGCASEELDEYRAETGNKLLPDLSDNIQCGNSIVDFSYYDFDKDASSNVVTLRSVRPFDWDDAFGSEGFDAIVGNPPYVRVQNLARYIPMEYRYYKSQFCSLSLASTPLLDKYQLFIERGLKLLKPSGRLGMIVPNKFLTIETGEGLRNLLANSYAISKIIDFGAQQIFAGRSTYTCIIVATPQKNDFFTRRKISSLAEFVASPVASGDFYPTSSLTSISWTFLPKGIEDHIASIAEKCSPLSSLARVFVGLQTSNDSAYIINSDAQDGELISFKDLNGDRRVIEAAICRPCLLDVEFESLGVPNPNRFIIFPYVVSSDKASLIPEEELASVYPHALEYLLSIKGILDRRAVSPRRNGNDWYKFGRSQSLRRFSGKPHLIWPVLSLAPKYNLDASGTTMFTGGGNGPYYGLEMNDDTPESIEYIQAVLSHWLVESIVQCRTSVFSGEYYSHGRQFVNDLPIRRIDFSIAGEKEAHDAIVAHVREIHQSMMMRDHSASRGDRQLHERTIEASKGAIRKIIDKLYAVDEDLEESAKG